jgi:hypothetical protein
MPTHAGNDGMGARTSYLERIERFLDAHDLDEGDFSSKVWGYRNIVHRLRCGESFTVRRLEVAEDYMEPRGGMDGIGMREGFVRTLERFLAQHSLSDTGFGMVAWANAKGMWRLRRGMNFSLNTIEKAEALMASIQADKDALRKCIALSRRRPTPTSSLEPVDVARMSTSLAVDIHKIPDAQGYGYGD